jgi:membrane associated rhomboid family serine protease
MAPTAQAARRGELRLSPFLLPYALVADWQAAYVGGTVTESTVNQPREPVFNIPSSVVATVALLGLIHAVRELMFTPAQEQRFLLLFSFIPARYDPTVLPGGVLPGGWGAEIWTFVTYALIHADLTHLGFNAVWLLPFGSALARRFGALRFFAFLAVTAAAGAAAHLITHSGKWELMIGASASISGTMAAAMRFAFQRGGPLVARYNERTDHVPAAPLGAALRDSRVLAFLGVWFGLNMLFGLGSVPLFDGEQSLAWQAHIGGFLAGLLLFAAFDPRRAHGSQDNEPMRD